MCRSIKQSDHRRSGPRHPPVSTLTLIRPLSRSHSFSAPFFRYPYAFHPTPPLPRSPFLILCNFCLSCYAGGSRATQHDGESECEERKGTERRAVRSGSVRAGASGSGSARVRVPVRARVGWGRGCRFMHGSGASLSPSSDAVLLTV